ncbi:MAG TPA: HD domain-containing phosphohydrolase [Pyrinomonadaceae bacterium]|jgi:putative nucleotidyltransferase with HDIG domain
MSEPPNGRRARILITDDEPELRTLLFDLLSGRYECKAVASAEEALVELRGGEFEIIISDIMMRGMSGLEMIPHLRELAPDAVVIMVSGTQTVESAIEALRAGAFDYLMKPFDLRHVEAAVSRALEHHELRAAKRRYETRLEEMVEERTAALHHALSSLEDAYRTTLKALTAALETRDSETHGHSERVVSFSLRLGREMGLNRDAMRALEFGALLHDIGKIGVPDAILRKPAKLTSEEWTKMRLHPLLGQQILRGIEFLEGAAHVVAQHHEKWDGSGYPMGLRSTEIDLNARIFAVADAFDVMTSDRVYRAGRSYDVAAAELDEYAAKQFDADVVAAFHRVPREEWDEMRRAALAAREERKASEPSDVAALRALLEERISVYAR